MPHFPRPVAGQRAPRVRVLQPLSARVRIEGQVLEARIHTLSLTGGALEMKTQLPPGMLTEIHFRVPGSSFFALCEMLPRVKQGGEFLQPFQFIGFDEEAHHCLQVSLKSIE